MALLSKDGEVVEVVDPAAPALLEQGWSEATAEEARLHYATPGDPAEAVNTSHEAKRRRAAELGLNPDVVQNHAALAPVAPEAPADDAKELGFKDLQARAKELGLSAAGSKAELQARIAEAVPAE